jgi:hypothetical protein
LLLTPTALEQDPSPGCSVGPNGSLIAGAEDGDLDGPNGMSSSRTMASQKRR